MKERFKIIRSYYGLSQPQFAEKIHRSPGFISNVETGRSRISEKTLNAICEAFPIDRSWLMTGVNSVTGKTGEGGMFACGEGDDAGEHNPVDKEGFASRVRAVRKYVDLTQEEFGRRIGYSKIQICYVEKGKVIPSNQFLEKVASEFGINKCWIFTGSGNMEDQEHEKGQGLDDRLIRWLNKHPEVIQELRKRSGIM